MKPFPLFVIAIALGGALVPPFTDSLRANAPQTPHQRTVPEKDYPLGVDCVVTVDPLDASTKVYAGDANVVTGFSAPDTVEGVLIHIDENWLILRKGKAVNWVPRKKVLLLHVSI